MSLTKETIKKLRIVKGAILAQPEYYSQNAWVSKIEACGTTCCIAGWVDYIFNGKKAHEARAKRLNSKDIWCGEIEWRGVVLDAIGLTERQTEMVTDPASYWPSPFCENYEDAKTPKDRAKVAAARIEHFIATGGDE